MEFRKANLDAFVKKYGIKLGFMSVFSKAAAYALQDQPVVNAVIDGQVKFIVTVDLASINFFLSFYHPDLNKKKIGNRLQRLR